MVTAACLLPPPAPSAWSSPAGKGPRETLAWLSFLLLHNQPLLWPRQPLPAGPAPASSQLQPGLLSQGPGSALGSWKLALCLHLAWLQLYFRVLRL